MATTTKKNTEGFFAFFRGQQINGFCAPPVLQQHCTATIDIRSTDTGLLPPGSVTQT